MLNLPRAVPPLHDLLGVSFVFNSGIAALAWDRDFACFGLADGAVAILRAHWQGAPDLAPRAGGGIEIVASSGPPPPPAIFPLHKGPVHTLATDPLGGVVTGGSDGFVLRLIDGEVQTLDRKSRKHVTAVAAGRGGRRAYAVGRTVDMTGPDARRLTMPAAVTALAYDPAGLHLAIGYKSGVSLEACGIKSAPRLEMSGPVTALAWRPDGGAVAVAFEGGVAMRDRTEPDWKFVEDLAGTVTWLGFLSNGNLLVAGADFLQHCPRHGVTTGPLTSAGKALRAPAACAPRLNLFAAADADGQILLQKIAVSESMLLREAGPAPVCMAFAPDGQALAFAAADGEAGTVILPDLLFRTRTGAEEELA
jgi:hypothetical protein